MAEFKSLPEGLESPPDKQTAGVWSQEVIDDLSALATKWHEVNTAYEAMQVHRQDAGMPVVGGQWTESHEQKYRALGTIVYTVIAYAEEVQEGTRGLARDAQDALSIIGLSNEVTVFADGDALVIDSPQQPTQRVGVAAWPSIPIAVAVVAGIALIVYLGVRICDTLKGQAEQAVAADIEARESQLVAAGMDPAEAHRMSQNRYKILTELTAARAKADASSGTSSIEKTVHSVAWAGLGIAIIAGGAYMLGPAIRGWLSPQKAAA